RLVTAPGAPELVLGSSGVATFTVVDGVDVVPSGGEGGARSGTRAHVPTAGIALGDGEVHVLAGLGGTVVGGQSQGVVTGCRMAHHRGGGPSVLDEHRGILRRIDDAPLHGQFIRRRSVVPYRAGHLGGTGTVVAGVDVCAHLGREVLRGRGIDTGVEHLQFLVAGALAGHMRRREAHFAAGHRGELDVVVVAARVGRGSGLIRYRLPILAVEVLQRVGLRRRIPLPRSGESAALRRIGGGGAVEVHAQIVEGLFLAQVHH